MSPAEHGAYAEKLLDVADQTGQGTLAAVTLYLGAIAHALMAQVAR